MTKTYSKTRILVEGALMIALSTVLSMIQIPLMPHGGSITLFSMVPILVMSYRHGAKWGVMTAFVNSLIQLVQGLGNLAYCQTLTAQVGCVLLDYLLAFTVLGFACLIAKPFRSRTVGVGVSAFVVCLLRFLCSFLSGVLVWGNLNEGLSAWTYSLVYNASYMLPETLITVVGAVLLIKAAPQIFDRQYTKA